MARPAAFAAPIAPRRPNARAAPLARLRIVPGLLLTAAIAAAAYGLRAIPGVGTFSPMILAILLGIGLHNTFGTPSLAQAGVAFTLRPVLRLAIILFGLQLTAQQVAAFGAPGVAVIVISLVATFFVTKAPGQFGTAAHADDLMQRAQATFKVIPSVVPAVKENPITREKIELGKMLFFEPRLFIRCTAWRQL